MTTTRPWGAYGVLLVILFTLCASSSAEISVQCGIDACTMITGKAYFDINAAGSFLYLVDNGQPRRDLSSLTLGFSHVIERERRITGSTGKACAFNTMDPFGSINADGDQIGALLGAYNLTDLRQTYEYQQNHPYPGVHTVLVSYLKPDSNQTLVVITYSLPETSFEIVEETDTQYTYGFIPTTIYRENSLKIGLYLNNYEWNGPNTGDPDTSSFVIIYLNISGVTIDGDMITAYQWNSTYVNLTNSIHNYAMHYYLEHFYYIDGQPYLAASEPQPTQYPPVYSAPPTLVAVRICKSSFSHWTNLTYDPGIGVLFSGFDSSAPPEGSPEQAKTNKNVTVAVAVAVPVVFVAVASFVLMAVFVKPVYNAVLPSDPFGRYKITKAGIKDGDLAANEAPAHHSASAPAPIEAPAKSWTSSRTPTIQH